MMFLRHLFKKSVASMDYPNEKLISTKYERASVMLEYGRCRKTVSSQFSSCHFWHCACQRLELGVNMCR